MNFEAAKTSCASRSNGILFQPETEDSLEAVVSQTEIQQEYWYDNGSENIDTQDVQTHNDVEETNVVESEELATKRRLIEEKRQKLMELEEAYLEEFGDEENLDDVEEEANVVVENKKTSEKDDKNVSVELIYDSVLACYFDPSTGRYYEIQQES